MEFSDLALAKLLQTMPELGSFILNFQDLSEEAPPESEIKVGVFILKMGSEIAFVPVMGKADTLYPIDSVFLQSTGKFTPLSRKTVESLINTGQLEKGTATKIPRTVNANPSLESLVTPPKTGKFVYASTSRMIDFLAGMPDGLKTWVHEKIAAERSAYDNLDQMFGMKAILEALKPLPSSPSLARSPEPISIVTAANPTLTQEDIQAILADGYVVQGSQPRHRIAVSTQNYHRDGMTRRVSSLDGDCDYDLSMKHGPSREAFLPKPHALCGGKKLAIFSNMDYAVSTDGFVVTGDPLDRRQVLTRAFEFKPPVLLRDTMAGDTITICTSSGTFLGPFSVDKTVLDMHGVTVTVSDRSGGNIRSILGYRNFKGEADMLGKDLCVPYNSIVLKLESDLSMDLEVSEFRAADRRLMETVGLLGSEINLAFDGIEFLINNLPHSSEAAVMQRLVVKEGIDPYQARSFVKQAREVKKVKIYLSKQAASDPTPAEVPQYGTQAEDHSRNVGPNGAFMSNVQQAAKVGDAQTTEATVLSQLLQVPDMQSQISEYMPDVEEAVDRLGRILFLSRLNMDQLSETQGSDAVFTLLAQLKAVYRMLGENLIRLKQIIEVSRGEVTQMEG